MAVCKKCGTQNVEESLFCVGCGQKMEGLTCPRCTAPVTENLKFCGKCGMPLDGSTICGGCGTVLPPDVTFCNTCGLRTDGKVQCTACGEAVEQGNLFCTACGAPLQRTVAAATKPVKPAAMQTAPQKKIATAERNKQLAALIRCFAAAGMLLVIVVCSFFSMFKMETKLLGISLKVNVSAVDLIAAPFRMINPPTLEQAETEFAAYAAEHIRDLGSNPTPKQQANEISRLLSNYGVMRLSITTETIQDNPLGKTKIILWAVIAASVIGVSLGFFIAVLVQAVRELYDKKKRTGKLAALAFGLLTGLTLSFMMTTGGTLGGASIAILLLSLLGLAGLGGCAYTIDGTKFDLRRGISRGVSAVVALIMVCCMASGALSITLTNEEDTSQKIGSQASVNDIMNSFNPSLETEIGSLVEEYPSINATLFSTELTRAQKKELIRRDLTPGMLFRYKETPTYYESGIIVNWFLFAANLLSAAAMVALFTLTLRDLAQGDFRKRRLWLHILCGVGALSLVALCSTFAAMANSVTRQLSLKLVYGIGAGVVTALVFGIGSAIQNGILLAPPRKPKTAPAATEPVYAAPVPPAATEPAAQTE